MLRSAQHDKHTRIEVTMDETTLAGHKPAPEYSVDSAERKIQEALRAIKDPEIGLDVIQLGLIREILLNHDEPEIKMVLTTPFCPYGGWLIQQIQDTAQQTHGKQIKITVLPEMWDPNYMEDPGLLMGW
jgi:metal-sulfur cluster biosynthetic enzyme